MHHSAGIVKVVCRILQDIVGRRLDKEDLEKPLRTLGVDSVHMIGLIGSLESEFHIRILDEEITPDHFRSVWFIAHYLEGKL